MSESYRHGMAFAAVLLGVASIGLVGTACDGGEVARAVDAAKDKTTADLGATEGSVPDGPATDQGTTDKGTSDLGGPPCDQAMDASGVGPCDMHLGTKWDGTQCVNVSGCSCTGSDCDKLFSTMGECKQAYSHCITWP